jgi:hypothetical protein
MARCALRAAARDGTERVTLASLENPGGIERLSADPNYWTNRCAADYYAVEIEALAPPPRASAAELEAALPVEAEFGGAVRLLGYRLDPIVAGAPLRVTLYWLPVAHTDRPYTVFVHLLHPALGSVAQADAYPGDGQYPTTLWIHRRPFADVYALPLPASPEAGTLTLVAGFYDLATGQRLPARGAAAAPGGEGWAVIAPVVIEP